MGVGPHHRAGADPDGLAGGDAALNPGLRLAWDAGAGQGWPRQQ